MSCVMGIDPGRTIADSCSTVTLNGALIERASAYIVPALRETLNAAVVEWPHTIANQGGADIDACIRTAAVIVDRLSGLGVPVYTPFRKTLLQQLGHSSRTKGNRDSWLLHYLQGMGHKTGRGTLLNSTHARSAFACCLFNYSHPANQRYLHIREES